MTLNEAKPSRPRPKPKFWPVATSIWLPDLNISCVSCCFVTAPYDLVATCLFVTVRDASVRLNGAFLLPEPHWSRRRPTHIDCSSRPIFVELFVYTPVGPTIYMYTIYRPLYDRAPTARLQDNYSNDVVVKFGTHYPYPRVVSTAREHAASKPDNRVHGPCWMINTARGHGSVYQA